jgi:hypothetical protein
VAAGAAAVTIGILLVPCVASAQITRGEFDDLVRRVDGLEQSTERLHSDLQTLIRINTQLAEHMAAMSERNSLRIASHSEPRPAEVEDSQNRIVIQAYGNSQIRVPIADGGFLDVRGSGAGASAVVPSTRPAKYGESQLASRSKRLRNTGGTQGERSNYHVTHAPVPIAYTSTPYSLGRIEGPPYGSQILLPAGF